MTSHVAAMALFAACVSVVFATLLRDEPREQVAMGARMFGALVGGACVAGWIMFAIFR